MMSILNQSVLENLQAELHTRYKITELEEVKIGSHKS